MICWSRKAAEEDYRMGLVDCDEYYEWLEEQEDDNDYAYQKAIDDSLMECES